MISIFEGVYWCTLQVNLVIIFGLVCAAVRAQLAPGRACSIACGTIVVAAALTVLSPVPTHRWMVLAADRFTDAAEPVNRRGQQFDSVERSDAARQIEEASGTVAITLNLLGSAARVLATGVEGSRSGATGVFVVAGWCCVVSMAFGVFRLLVGLAFVARTQRSGTEILDVDLIRLAHELAAEIGCSSVPSFRESPTLTTAAVAGFHRPVLVLPGDWRKWSDDECRTVIAHELAHVFRRDSAWRCFASCVLTMHFFNPFVHWLVHRVVLYQELAADGMAVTVVGRRRYVRALSKLAMQRDHVLSGQRCPNVMPIFTGQLTRRIRMLQSTEGSKQSSHTGQQARPVIVLASIIMLGVAAIAGRGFAQLPDEREPTSSQPPRDSNIRQVSRSKPSSPSISTEVKKRQDGGLFSRQHVPVSAIVPNEDGMVVVRVKELLERPALGMLEPLLVDQLSSWFHSVVPHGDVPAIDLRAIDWVAAKAMLGAKYRADAPKGTRHSVSWGTNAVHVKFHDDLNLAAWMAKYIPNVVRHEVEGRGVYWMPAITAIGPYPVLITEREDNLVTITFQGPADEISKATAVSDLFGDRQAWRKAPLPTWARQWNEVNGGLVCMAVTGDRFSHAVDPDMHDTKFSRAWDEFQVAVIQRCSHYALGLDTNESGTTCVLKMRMTHKSRSTARDSAEELRHILDLSRGEQELKMSDAHEQRVVDLTAAFMQHTQFVVEDSADGRADLVMTISMPIGELAVMFN